MNHRRARRLLSEVLDHTLPAPVEGAVRDHIEGCERCAAELAELVAVEGLLRRLPASLVPLDPSPEADARLASLARWSGGAEPAWSQRFGLSALGALAAAGALVVVLSVSSWAPVMEKTLTYPSYAAVFPETGLVPSGWR